jgi:hypothetical protein
MERRHLDDLIQKHAVLRVTRTRRGSDEEAHDPPIWAISRETGSYSAGVYADWLIGETSYGQGVLDHSDEFEIVPPDEWPDEVCVEVARRVLGGEN